MKNIRKRGLKVNTNKTEYIVVGNTCKDIVLEQEVVERVDGQKRRHARCHGYKDDTSVAEIKNLQNKRNK